MLVIQLLAPSVSGLSQGLYEVSLKVAVLLHSNPICQVVDNIMFW